MKLPLSRFHFSLACLCALAEVEATAQPIQETLTNASEVLSLSAEQALQGQPVKVKGVVTADESYWDGRFFIQDASGGVFVDNISNTQPQSGDIVEVSGITHPGAFAPVISRPSWKILGRGSLPPAKLVSVEQLMSCGEDSQRVEVRGRVQWASEEHSLLSVDVVSGGYRFHVFARPIPGVDPQALVGASIRVRGTAAASFNAQLRQLITVKIFAPLAEDFIIEATESIDPFSQPFLPLASIGQYRPGKPRGTRVHVKGIVTYQQLGDALFLTDNTGGLQVRSRQRQGFAPGDTVEAAGFAGMDDYLPVLEDAVLRKTDEPRAEVIPRRASAEELQAGLHHANLVRVRAKLLDRAVRRSIDPARERMQVETLMMLQSGNLVFSAETQSSEAPPALVSAPIGSLLEVTGVCVSESDEEGKVKLLRLLLPPAQPILVLQRPSWFTPRHLVASLAVAIVVLLVAITWTLVIARKNSTLRVLVREKEQAQQQLQLAHDQLDARVKERTEQLHQQMTARKESESQFKVVLSERTRLAQELHDTLEQTLTGIALQMDTATRLVHKSPEEADNHLRLARGLVGQGQIEVRRSVWDLRSRALEQFDLTAALNASCRQITDGTGVRVAVSAHGPARRLPDLVETNLLRIAQESLTNVIKHAGASKANIRLDYQADQVVLEIRDDGKGFSAEHCAGPLNGHFGLLGISERVKRINGQVAVQSVPGAGTTVRVEIPIIAEQETGIGVPVEI